MNRSGLIGKKPKDARAAWRVCTKHPHVYAPWDWTPIDRWALAASRRKT